MKKLFVLGFLFVSFIVKAQTDSTHSKKFELTAAYSIQCPLYSVNSSQDLMLTQDTRFRSRIGLGIKYYPFQRWYGEYSMSFSQEGGGYIQQKTNANYFKNSFLLGYSSLDNNRIIFNILCGFEVNLLLNARLINELNGESDNVSDYYHRVNISFPIGLGFKTQIVNGYYFGCHTYVSFSPYSISSVESIKVSQIIFPAFQFSISKFLN
jgi:hypothetical protein